MRERPARSVHPRPQLREITTADPTPSFGDPVVACVTARRRTVPHGTRPAQCVPGRLTIAKALPLKAVSAERRERERLREKDFRSARRPKLCDWRSNGAARAGVDRTLGCGTRVLERETAASSQDCVTAASAARRRTVPDSMDQRLQKQTRTGLGRRRPEIRSCPPLERRRLGLARERLGRPVSTQSVRTVRAGASIESNDGRQLAVARRVLVASMRRVHELCN